MNCLKLLLTLSLTLSFSLGFAQSGGTKMKGKIVGKIVNSADATIIEYATVSILNAENELVTGGVTDETGAFSIPVPYGSFSAKIESISFKVKTFEDLTVSKDKSTLNLETIKMEPDVTTLGVVEVTEEKSRVQFGLDKKIFNVGKDITSVGGGVTEVLDNIPSVSVDPQGNVSLRGSSSVKILIDGKPSALTSAKLLKNMQSNLVDKIELITNPSAKNDAEGLTGIINIVMKKQKKVGVSGSVSADVAHPHDYSVGVNLNRRTKKVNVFTNFGVRYWQRPINNRSDLTYTFADTTYFTKWSEEKTRRSFSYNANVGLDYFLNDGASITTSFLIDRGRQPHDAAVFYQDFNENQQPSYNELRLNDELEIEYTLEYLLSYEKNLKKKGQKIEGFVKYIDYTEKNDSDLSEFLTDAEQKPVNSQVLKQRTSVDETDRNLIFQLDYTHPFSERGKLEMGAKSTFRNITNNFLVEEQADSDWMTLDNLSNDFVYDENVYAAYTSVSNEKKGFSYKLGLRGELTELRTELKQTNEVNERDPFFNLFPSVHLGYKFKNNNSVQASYSRRIQRPNFYNLNPFVSFTDDRFISTGNPDLNPMYTNSFEISHLKYWDRMSMSSSIYHRQTTDLISTITKVGTDGVTFLAPENLDGSKTSGFEFFLEREIKKWMSLSGSVDLFYAELDGSSLEDNLLTDYFAWSVRFRNRITLPKDFVMQLSYFYAGPSATIQGTQEAVQRLDFGMRKNIMKRKGTLYFTVRDVLNTYRIRYENITPEIVNIGVNRPWRPTFSLGFQYRWK